MIGMGKIELHAKSRSTTGNLDYTSYPQVKKIKNDELPQTLRTESLD